MLNEGSVNDANSKLQQIQPEDPKFSSISATDPILVEADNKGLLN